MGLGARATSYSGTVGDAAQRVLHQASAKPAPAVDVNAIATAADTGRRGGDLEGGI